MENKPYVIKNIASVPSDLFSMPFGRQIEYHKVLHGFINNPETKKTYLSQKRQSYKKAIKEFVKLYEPKSYYIPKFNSSSNCFDDSFVVYYQ
jgi:hypothetical protein